MLMTANCTIEIISTCAVESFEKYGLKSQQRLAQSNALDIMAFERYAFIKVEALMTVSILTLLPL